MSIIISGKNANGTFTGTNLNYIHIGLCPLIPKEKIFNDLIFTPNVQTILANISADNANDATFEQT